MTVLTAEYLSILQVDQASLRTLPRGLRRTITKLDQYIGKDARILIATATSATPFTVHPEMNLSLRGNQIRSHEILERHPPLSTDQLLQIKSLILNPDNHLWVRHADYWCQPEVAIRFSGEADLPVLIDFITQGWCLSKERGATGPDSRFVPVAQQLSILLAPYRLQEHHGVSSTDSESLANNHMHRSGVPVRRGHRDAPN